MSEQKAPDGEWRLLETLNLLKDADSVELKFTVPENDHRSVLGVLDLDVLDAKLRQVVFFDTPDLKLNRAGVVVRARRTTKGGDTVVKLRPLAPDTLPKNLRRLDSFKVEIDVMPGNFVCSGSLRGKVDNDDVKQVVSGKRAVGRLFLPAQRAFYRRHAPKGVDLDSLTPLGPINVAKLKFSPKAFKGYIASAEMWFYPDGSRILELSTRCTHDDVFQLAAQARAQLARFGLSVTGDQQTKTRKALDYFSRIQSRPKK